MPIQLDNLTASMATPSRALTPKYFSSKLTGSGKKTGLIHEGVRPTNVSLTQTMSVVNNPIERKTKQVAGDVTTNYIPMAPMMQRCLDHNSKVTLAVPEFDEMCQIHTAAGQPEMWLNLTPQALILKEDASQQGTVYRELLIQYRVELYSIVDPKQTRAAITTFGRFSNTRNEVSLEWTFNAPKDAYQVVQNHLPPGSKPNANTIGMWMDDYDVHEQICRLANEWSSDEMSEEMSTYITELGAASPSETDIENLCYQLRYLETYGVSLSAYRDIHAAIKAAFKADVASTLCKQNLNLLMNATLENLNAMKGQLSSPPQAAPGFQAVMQSKFSTQQKLAVGTDEPLVLVQAGAGTGKSTVILGRIEHLVSRGVKPEDITVLSFTNAAADNIAAKNPSIGSMTIARMIHDIYNENYKGHELSSIDTIINSLDIFFPQNDLAARFRRHLVMVDKNEEGSYTAMNTFIGRNFDGVMEMLTAIRQTSLELEIIICYQKIDEMVEPSHVMSKYLIIDEVQDNSIFEFVFMLKYVAKHNENLYIVGKQLLT